MKKKKTKVILLILATIWVLALCTGLTMEHLHKKRGERLVSELKQMEVIKGVTFEQAINSFTEDKSYWVYSNGGVHISSYGEEHSFMAFVPDTKTNEIHFKTFIIDHYSPADSQELDAILFDLAMRAKNA